MKTTGIITIATILLMSLSTLTLFAQNPPNGPASGPIDGGILLLVAGAASLGYRKLRRKDVKINDQIAFYESVLNDHTTVKKD